jgi:hypothetical protein
LDCHLTCYLTSDSLSSFTATDIAFITSNLITCSKDHTNLDIACNCLEDTDFVVVMGWQDSTNCFIP